MVILKKSGWIKLKNILTVAVIIKCNGNYLFLKQINADGTFPDCLHIVGGKIENDETPEEAIRRLSLDEVDIELGEIVPFSFDSEITTYDGEQCQLISLCYLAKVNDFYANPGSDSCEALWLAKDELSGFEIEPMMERFLNRLGLM